MCSDLFQHRSAGVFRIAVYDGWLVIATSPQLIEEIRRAPDDTLLFEKAVQQILQTDYTVGSDTVTDPYHIDVVRNALTRNLNVRFADVWDEIQIAFKEEIGAGDGKRSRWVAASCDTELLPSMEGDPCYPDDSTDRQSRKQPTLRRVATL